MERHPVSAVQHALEAAAACVRAVLPSDSPDEDGEGMFAGDSAGGMHEIFTSVSCVLFSV